MLNPWRSRSSIKRSRIAVTGEIVVGDEEARDPLRRVSANDRFDIVGGAIARFAPLHIDDRAEAALERAAAPGVEAGIMSGDAGHDLSRQDRIDSGRHFRKVGEIIVDRFGCSGGDVAQDFGHAAFGFAGEQRDAEVARFLKIARQLGQHRDTAGDVETAHHHRNSMRAELPAEVKRARKLVGLHADQSDHPAAARANARGDTGDVDDRVALVAGFDFDLDVGTERAGARAFLDQAVDARQAVRR